MAGWHAEALLQQWAAQAAHDAAETEDGVWETGARAEAAAAARQEARQQQNDSNASVVRSAAAG